MRAIRRPMHAPATVHLNKSRSTRRGEVGSRKPRVSPPRWRRGRRVAGIAAGVWPVTCDAASDAARSRLLWPVPGSGPSRAGGRAWPRRTGIGSATGKRTPWGGGGDYAEANTDKITHVPLFPPCALCRARVHSPSVTCFSRHLHLHPRIPSPDSQPVPAPASISPRSPASAASVRAARRHIHAEAPIPRRWARSLIAKSFATSEPRPSAR